MTSAPTLTHCSASGRAGAILLPAGAAVVIAAALLLHYFYAQPEISGEGGTDVSSVHETAGNGLQAGAVRQGGDPGSLIAESLEQAGAGRLREPPPDAVAPPKAEFSRAYRLKTPDKGQADTVTYFAPGTVEQAANFYTAAMPQAGYKLIRRQNNLRQGLTLVFLKGTEQYIVNLYPADKEEVKATKIVVVIPRPGQG